MIGESPNSSLLSPGSTSLSRTMLMFDTATRSEGMRSVTLNVALMAGSSQQGNARRASVASNCVVARYFSAPSESVYLLR